MKKTYNFDQSAYPQLERKLVELTALKSEERLGMLQGSVEKIKNINRAALRKIFRNILEKECHITTHAEPLENSDSEGSVVSASNIDYNIFNVVDDDSIDEKKLNHCKWFISG